MGIIVCCSICIIIAIVLCRKGIVNNQRLQRREKFEAEIMEKAKCSAKDLMGYFDTCYFDLEKTITGEKRAEEVKVLADSDLLTRVLIEKISDLKVTIAKKEKIPIMKADLEISIDRIKTLTMELTMDDRVSRKYLKKYRLVLKDVFSGSVETYADPISFCRVDVSNVIDANLFWLSDTTPIGIWDAIIFSRLKNPEKLKEANQALANVAEIMYDINCLVNSVTEAEEELKLINEFIEKRSYELNMLGVNYVQNNKG